MHALSLIPVCTIYCSLRLYYIVILPLILSWPSGTPTEEPKGVLHSNVHFCISTILLISKIYLDQCQKEKTCVDIKVDSGVCVCENNCATSRVYKAALPVFSSLLQRAHARQHQQEGAAAHTSHLDYRRSSSRQVCLKCHLTPLWLPFACLCLVAFVFALQSAFFLPISSICCKHYNITYCLRGKLTVAY